MLEIIMEWFRTSYFCVVSYDSCAVWSVFWGLCFWISPSALLTLAAGFKLILNLMICKRAPFLYLMICG